jgi:hypothetical protein
MRIDRTHLRWAYGTLAAFLLSSTGYFIYAARQSGGPRGGTFVGIAFGILGYAAMLFEGFLGARKKVRTWRLFGKAQTWMRGHLWIGLLTLPLILFHAAFAFRGPLTLVLMILFFVVYLSGILGAFLQHYLPSMITARVPLETIYEEIPNRRQQLCEEADRFIDRMPVELEKADKLRFDKAYASVIRPFLEAPEKAGAVLAVEQKSAELFDSLRQTLHPSFQEILNDLQSICEEERQLIRQRRIYHWLHVWLVVHVPLSIVLLVLGGVHAIVALRY